MQLKLHEANRETNGEIQIIDLENVPKTRRDKL